MATLHRKIFEPLTSQFFFFSRSFIFLFLFGQFPLFSCVGGTQFSHEKTVATNLDQMQVLGLAPKVARNDIYSKSWAGQHAKL